MKKLLTSVVALSMLFALTAAPKSKKTAEVIEPISVKISADNMAENQATMQNQVFNADGSVTYDAMMKFGGGGISFFVDGKSGVKLSSYKKIRVEFDYSTDKKWKNENMTPKFKIVTWGPGTTYYNGGADQGYFDSEGRSGSMVYEMEISKPTGKVVKVAIPLNAWKWVENGGSEEDLVTMTIKSITLLP